MKVVLYTNKPIDIGSMKDELETATQKRCVVRVQEDNSLAGAHADFNSKTEHR